MTDTDRTPEAWIYCGIREGRGKKWHEWRTAPDAEPMHFAKLSGRTVGAMYTVMVSRSPEGEFRTAQTGPEFAGEVCEAQAVVDGWQAEQRLAQARLARQRAERRIAQDPDAFERAIWPLRELRAKSARTRDDRVAFTAMVLDALSQ